MEPYIEISDVAQEMGVSSRTIRYYGELGLLPEAHRSVGGRRMYGPESIERLRFISRLKSLGLTLEEIRDLHQAFEEGQTPAMLERLDAQLLRHLRQVEFKLGELTQLDADLRTYLDRIREKRT